MKKSFSLILIAALAALLIFTGCPTGNDTSSEDDVKDTTPATTPPATLPESNPPKTVTIPTTAAELAKVVESIKGDLTSGKSITLTAASGENPTIPLTGPSADDKLVIPADTVLTVGDHVTLDLTTTGDGNSENTVKVNGTINVKNGATLKTEAKLDNNGYVIEDEANDFYGPNGKIVLDSGSTIVRNDVIFLGTDDRSFYTWDGKGEVELGKDTLTLKTGTLVVNAASAGIISGDTATIAKGATLQIPPGKNFVLYDGNGDPDTNAKLVVSGTIEVEGKITFKAPFSDYIEDDDGAVEYATNIDVKQGGVILLKYGSTLTVPGDENQSGSQTSGVAIEVVGASGIFQWATSPGDGASIEIGAGTSTFTIKGGTVTLASAYKVYAGDKIVVDAGATLALAAIALSGEESSSRSENPSAITIIATGKITTTSTTFNVSVKLSGENVPGE
jgi:hypothetical protein